MTFEEIYKQVENIPGWMGKQDCEALYNATKDMQGVIFEIGCFMGKSTRVMAQSSNAHIVAIDPFLTVHSSSGMSTPMEALRGLLKNIRGFNIEFYLEKSEDISLLWNTPPEIDFLHIDGDHHYETVKKDIELFVPHVKKGHYVYFHDYVVNGTEEDGGRVKEAVRDMADKYFNEVKTVSGFAACRKK